MIFMKSIIIYLFILILLTPDIAHAYVGPGMSGGLIASVIGVIVGLFAAIIGIIFFPLKRYFKKKKE